MKKQTNSAVKAHLLRGALFLLLLTAVCAIPFALGGRNQRTVGARMLRPARPALQQLEAKRKAQTRMVATIRVCAFLLASSCCNAGRAGLNILAPTVRWFRPPRANGMAHTAVRRSKKSAPRKRCALTAELVCFFMGEVYGSEFSLQIGVWECAFNARRTATSSHFITFL